MRLNETGMSAHTDNDMDVARVEGELSLTIEEEDHWRGGTSVYC